MSNGKYPLVMFKVEILLSGNEKGRTMFCLGIDDVHNFVKQQKINVGKENYSGYSSEAIPLSRHAESAIRKGVSSLSV